MKEPGAGKNHELVVEARRCAAGCLPAYFLRSKHARLPHQPKNGRSQATVKEGIRRRRGLMLLRLITLVVVVGRRDIYVTIIDAMHPKKDAVRR